MDIWDIKDGFALGKKPFGKGRESYEILTEELNHSCEDLGISVIISSRQGNQGDGR